MSVVSTIGTSLADTEDSVTFLLDAMIALGCLGSVGVEQYNKYNK